MNENLNLTELLKDCPKGMPLDCAMFDDVTFTGVEKKIKPISIRAGEIYYYLTEFGTWSYDENAKCVIFPKGKTTWEGFQRPFVDGDVVYAKDDGLSYILIYHKQIDERVYRHACLCLETDMFGCDKDCIFTDEPIDEWRLATEEEKQKLFDAIKAHGYKWNEETKTLEKLIVPKFKVGDKVRNKANGRMTGTIIALYKEVYEVKNPLGNEFPLDFRNQDNWELVPNKFDPKTLKPFDKVLVRCKDDEKWLATTFSHIEKHRTFKFTTSDAGHYFLCIPYNDDTKHLVGTTGNAPEFYRYWEE